MRWQQGFEEGGLVPWNPAAGLYVRRVAPSAEASGGGTRAAVASTPFSEGVVAKKFRDAAIQVVCQ